MGGAKKGERGLATGHGVGSSEGEYDYSFIREGK